MRMAALLLVSGCTFGSGDAAPGRLRGVPLDPPLARPAFTLITMDGRPFEFRRDTGGRLTLVFFGYTNCPDVCPVTLATIEAVRRDLPPDLAAGLQVLFVTTDPARDSAAVVQAWLAKVAPSALGLTGSPAAIAEAERLLRVPPSTIDTAAGRYQVGHAAQVVVFTPDDSAHLAYPFGTRQADWAADLPRLARWRARR